MELVFTTLFHRLYFVVTQKCVNMSHVKDWCIGYLLLCNKLPQILCLKTTFIIHSLCGSRVWIRLSWVPVAPGLSKLWVSQSSGGENVLPRALTCLLAGPRSLEAVGLRSSFLAGSSPRPPSVSCKVIWASPWASLQDGS